MSGATKFLILRPGGFYFSNYAPRVSSKGADSFSMLLRKLFSGKFLESITQLNGDRLVELKFLNCEWSLISELFGRGNMIIVDSQYMIKHALAYRSWKSREIKRDVKYTPPPFTNWFLMNKLELTSYIEGLSKAEVSRKLGLGKEIETIWDDQPQQLTDTLMELVNQPLKMDEVEAMFKQDDLSLVSEKEKKLLASLAALEKSKEKTEALIKTYEQDAPVLRKAANSIFMDLKKWDKALEKARSQGKKRLKVS
ncbi:MAG: hypothetical protein GOV00_01865 [Candidatus Altiarchaeota archaeon]|nr:hypothetical protein [Candidatus Altiarchaeota archaeon]